MNKKTCAAFICFLAVLVGLTACTRSSKYGKVIVDSKGMEHIIMTDASGVTVCDPRGNLVEIVTDSHNKKPITAPTENGTLADGQQIEYQTQSVTFPGILEQGNVVEDQYCMVTLPDGWKQIGRGRMILEHEATQAQISVFLDVYPTLTGKLDQMETDRAMLDADYEYNETEAVIDGYNAVCCTYKLGNIFRQAYVFQTDRDMVIEITCTVDQDKADGVDFDSVLSAIRFK